MRQLTAGRHRSHREQLRDEGAAPRGNATGVFVQVPIGLGWVNTHMFVTPAAPNWKAGPAFVFGLQTGLEAFITDQLGGYFSLGWSHHSFEIMLDQRSAVPAGVDIDQLVFHMGVSYMLSAR